MTTAELRAYRIYLQKLTDREFFTERETVVHQEPQNVFLMKAIQVELNRRVEMAR